MFFLDIERMSLRVLNQLVNAFALELGFHVEDLNLLAIDLETFGRYTVTLDHGGTVYRIQHCEPIVRASDHEPFFENSVWDKKTGTFAIIPRRFD